MISKNHYYFMIPLSPWPFIVSINSFNLLFSVLLMLKFSEHQILLFSVFMSSFTSFFWWLTYSGELNLEGFNSLNLENGIKFAMILFISSEIFFFFSFFWSYFQFFLAPSMELGLIWPPAGVMGFDCLNTPLINTLILLTSGITVTLAHDYLLKSKMILFNFFNLTTILLGLIFSLLQLIEYKSSFFGMGDSSFGTSFFMLTGFHGIHVLIGTMFLLSSLFRSYKLASSASEFVSFELASWYWHFVDVVWIFLYFFLYYMNQ